MIAPPGLLKAAVACGDVLIPAMIRCRADGRVELAACALRAYALLELGPTCPLPGESPVLWRRLRPLRISVQKPVLVQISDLDSVMQHMGRLELKVMAVSANRDDPVFAALRRPSNLAQAAQSQFDHAWALVGDDTAGEVG